MSIFAKEHQLEDIEPLLAKGALVAQSPALFEELEGLDDGDRTALREEVTHRFKLPKILYYTIVLNSIAAAIQGYVDELNWVVARVANFIQLGSNWIKWCQLDFRPIVRHSGLRTRMHCRWHM